MFKKHLYLFSLLTLFVLIMALKAYQASDSSSANDKQSDKYTPGSAWVFLKPTEHESIINEKNQCLCLADVFNQKDGLPKSLPYQKFEVRESQHPP